MRLQTAVKYNVWKTKRALLIFYGIIYGLFILAGITALTDGADSFSVSGLESASVIFIFILGLNFFSESFSMFMQNGISRRTMFFSYILSFIPLAALMALWDSVNGSIAGAFINYEGMFSQLYQLRYDGAGWQLFFEGLLWYMFAYGMFIALGLLITVLYYRMDKGQKLLVSIGVPVGLFVALPMIDNLLVDGAIFGALGRFFTFAMGFQNGVNPYYPMATFVLAFAIFAGLAYALIRKAVVRG